MVLYSIAFYRQGWYKAKTASVRFSEIFILFSRTGGGGVVFRVVGADARVVGEKGKG